MKNRDDLIIRLLQEANSNVKVLVRDRHDNILPIDSVRLSDVQVPRLQADLAGPLSHNETVLVIEVGPAIKQDMSIE